MSPDPPVECRAMTQHGINMAGDVRAVFGSDIATAAEVFGRDIVGRPFASIDSGENVDRGSDLCTWCQTTPWVSGPPGSLGPRGSSRCRAHGSRAAPTR